MRKHSKEEKQALIVALIRGRAHREKFRGKRIQYEPPSYQINPTRPKVVIRALYGPMKGLTSSSIVVLPYREELLASRIPGLIDEESAVHRDDGFGMWGPREFLYTLFQTVADFHGDCVIYMIHSGQRIEVDAEKFAEWVTQANEYSVEMLAALQSTLMVPQLPGPQERGTSES